MKGLVHQLDKIPQQFMQSVGQNIEKKGKEIIQIWTVHRKENHFMLQCRTRKSLHRKPATEYNPS